MSGIHTSMDLINTFSREWTCAFVQFVHKALTVRFGSTKAQPTFTSTYFTVVLLLRGAHLKLSFPASREAK